MSTEQRKKKVLLIDDDTHLLVTLGDFLEFEGYDVTTAETGEEGLERIVVEEPDLIVLDMTMPGMGGIGFLKEISGPDRKPRHPVLVLTARANMAEFFANVEVDGFVAKPCDPNDLLMEVARIVFLRSEPETGGVKDSTGKKKILLGEDDKVVNVRLTNAFISAGYIAISVRKGTEVMEKAIVEKPDIVVMNHILTAMNGDAVTKMLREMPSTKNIPVLLYDNSDSVEDPELFAKSGVSAFVPSDKSPTILNAVKETLEF